MKETVLLAHSTLPFYLECPMCEADEAFVISKQDPSAGYCFAKKREWVLSKPKCEDCLWHECMTDCGCKCHVDQPTSEQKG